MMPWWSGVDLRLGALVDAVEPDAVHLVGGEVVEGRRGAGRDRGPARWRWPASTLTAGGAVAVDAGLRTSVPGVFAVGDCAAWQSRR